jgi:phosphatidylglycerol:prolipoprotein diacylglycerol transferase
VLGILMTITLKRKRRFEGEIFLLYLLFYGIGRFWIEGLRTDQLLIPGTEIAVSQVLSALLATAAAILIALLRRHR